MGNTGITLISQNMIIHIDISGSLTLQALISALTMARPDLREGELEYPSGDHQPPDAAGLDTPMPASYLQSYCPKWQHALGQVLKDLSAPEAEWQALSLFLRMLDSLGAPELFFTPLPLPGGDDSAFILTLLQRWQLPARPTSGGCQGHVPLALALLAALGTPSSQAPAFTIISTGRAAADAVVLLVGEASSNGKHRDEVAVLEANIDDLNPEIYQYCQQQLFAAGALDVLLIPVFMKKQRPGSLLHVVARPEDAEKLAAIIFTETSTLGIRVSQAKRFKLQRSQKTVYTAWGEVGVKLGWWQGRLLNVAPEYEDCYSLANKAGVPLKFVYQQAISQFWQEHSGEDNE